MSGARPTALGYALLGLLHQAPQSGYDLRKIFATTAMGNYSSSPGAIYPALRRLEAEGLIAGEVDSSTALRPRKVYRPTAAGTEVLTRWLTRAITRDDIMRRSDELMLRFAFHWLLESPQATRGFLADFAEITEAYVHELEEQRKLFPAETPPQPRLALDAGIEQYRAAARWARSAQREFKEDDE